MQQAAAKQDVARVYNAGLNLLARREHSSKELKQKNGVSLMLWWKKRAPDWNTMVC